VADQRPPEIFPAAREAAAHNPGCRGHRIGGLAIRTRLNGIRPMRALRNVLLVGGLAALGILSVTLAADAGKIAGPSPDLDPAAAVRAQLEAMAHNDVPRTDAGIEVVFGFASPGNRAVTGPLPRFAQMLHKNYADLLNHRSATLQPTYIEGDAAMQGVELIDEHGAIHRYIFVLSRQTAAPCKGCWMTDSVLTGAGDRPAQTL